MYFICNYFEPTFFFIIYVVPTHPSTRQASNFIHLENRLQHLLYIHIHFLFKLKPTCITLTHLIKGNKKQRETSVFKQTLLSSINTFSTQAYKTPLKVSKLSSHQRIGISGERYISNDQSKAPDAGGLRRLHHLHGSHV